LIAAKDHIFLKAYLSMAIEATELQTEVKGFLRDTTTKYSETLELIHVDFRVYKTGEKLRDTTTRSGSTDIVRRDKTDDDVNLKKTDAPLKTTGSFPNNHGKLLPSEYYQQFREWYEVLSTFKSDRNSEQLTWIKKNPSSTSKWHIMVNGHATTNATNHTTTTPPDRTGTMMEVTKMTHVIVVGIRDVENIGGITVVVVVEVTKVT